MKTLTILAIDDDKDILTLVNHLLTQKGYLVLTANNGDEALAILKQKKPDIILLDVIMEKISGYDVCRQIHAHDEWSFIPVIFLTALASEKARAKALALGAVDFLTKPINKERLYGVIAKHAAIENKWRRFLQKKEDHPSPKSQSQGAQGIAASFSAFRKFLFEFLEASQGEIQRFQALGTEQLAMALQETNRLSQSGYAILMAQFTGLEYLARIEPEQILLDTLPLKFSRHNHVVSVAVDDKISFLITNPFNHELLATLQNMKPKKIFVTTLEVIREAYKTDGTGKAEEDMDTLARNIKTLYPGNLSDPDLDESTYLRIDPNASPLVRFVNQLLEQAFRMGASDIHIEPLENRVVIRFRIDGELVVAQQLYPRGLISLIASRIKIMAKMDIAERRLPQDGRFSYKQSAPVTPDFDVRVSSAPMNYGEKIVLRIIDKSKVLMPVEHLGFSPGILDLYRRKIKAPYGMILHVGPTGSGKSMSLYSALNEINRPNINILTAEDPIEYTLDGISQLQVNPVIGLGFKEALRCFLRQDPDVILVGEIRDQETAMMAVEAALTGHLLFSTLHTNDAPSTVIRFIKMGIAPYLVSSSIVLICAQRLLRRLCPECKTPYTPDETEKHLAGLPPHSQVRFYRAVGCPACSHTGYHGRIGVYELLVPNEAFREAMGVEHLSTEVIRKIAVEQCGMVPLFRDAMEKVQNGITTMAEALAKTTPPALGQPST